MKLYLTSAGQELLYKAQGGQMLKFTRFGLGDGELSGQAIQTLTNLISEKMQADLKKLEVNTSKVVVGMSFSNSELAEGFYFRELGLFAEDPDTSEEILYMYANFGETSDYIDANTGRVIEENLDVEIYVSNVQEITAVIDDSLVYATQQDLDELNEKISSVVAKNAGAHNALYRGKDITDLFYDGTLSQQIANQTFDEIFVGDYIIGKTSGRKYLVADINYRLHCGNTECTTPHILMIPEKVMGSAGMHSSNDGSAYIGSEMYTTHLETYKEIIRNDFGTEHILKHHNYFANAITDNYESAGAWYESDIELMNELMVYGTDIWHNVRCGTNFPHNYTIDKSQLSLFRHRKDLIVAFDDDNKRKSWWLRDAASHSDFAIVRSSGDASHLYLSNAHGIRPAFLIY